MMLSIVSVLGHFYLYEVSVHSYMLDCVVILRIFNIFKITDPLYCKYFLTE